uniref:Trehalase n=2 Tax=Panagrolaimus sp. JU765 TaxID=591449 RepID=A0AC34PUN2_9BILA
MPHNIYCQGSLLAAVQTARLFGDCKHFVDMPLKRDPELTLRNWDELMNKVGVDVIDPAVLTAFVNEHFEQPGDELEEHEPSDFQNNVTSFAKIADPAYRTWAMELHRKWPTLCRRVSRKVFSNPERYSLIPLPNPFVVPGGRFREMYYWDSFFTIKGLIASQMYSTVRQMIENMGWLIENFGFVPNGNRIYYLNRSQPPLLTWCVDAYYQATGDTEFLQRAMTWLEREMQFFVDNRRILKPDWKTHLFRYHVVAFGPRPESYREDVESAEHIADAPGKLRLWGDIMAAAESGRDFSARWFHADGPMANQMGSTRTSSVLPVDLNSIICGNLRTFADFYKILGMSKESEVALNQYKLMRETIHQVFWNENHSCWFDYDLDKNEHICTYYDTNFFPLMTGIAHDEFDPEKFQAYLKTAGVLEFPGGIPSSLIASGHQWDYPFNFPSTTWVMIEGLRMNKMPELAKSVAEKWVRRNYDMWINNGGRMFEKYNVATLCYKAFGGGGEYELQEGFGWTNGVILDLLLKYGNDLFWEKHEHFEPDCKCCTTTTETSTTTTAPQDSFAHCGLEDNIMVNCGILQKA